MNPAIPVLAVFVATACVLAAVFLLLRDLLFRRGGRTTEPRVRVDRLRDRGARPSRQLDARFADGGGFGFARLIAESGLEISTFTGLLLVIVVATFCGGAALVAMADPLSGWAGLLVGTLLALAGLSYVRARRLRKLQEQLPEALELLVRAVRAGESMDQAVTLLGEEVPRPLGIEMKRFAKHLELGLSVSAAAGAMTQRVPLPDARILATTLIVQRTAGGNLAKTLERLSEVVRDRLNFRRQFRATSAGSRMAAILVTSVGVMAFAAIWLLEPDYLRRFFDDRAGMMIFGAIVFLQLVGIVWVLGLLKSND